MQSYMAKKILETDGCAKQELNRIVLLRLEQEWREAANIMHVLRPALNIEQFLARRTQLINEGYCLIGVKSEEQIVSIASYTISPHAMLGRELLIHDMATLQKFQGRGYASVLIDELVRIAARSECGRLFVHTRNAQKLYSKAGFEQYSTGMIKKL